jgi:NADH-quinone oxidoreductase subunit M
MLAREDLGRLTFDLVEIAEGADFAANTGRWLFFAFAIAFAVKVPIFPLHTWLPDAHTQAPTAGSVVLAGVMLKLGTYGFLRFGLYLFPEAAVWSRSLWLTLAVIGIIYGAIAATMQKDLKRLVAYSSVAHLGFIILGTFAFTSQAISGSVLQMVNHGVSTGALFLLVGMIYERRKTRQISELGGIQKVAPIFAAGFMIVMLSSIGVPGLNGFIGEYLILLGSFQTARWWTVVATAGVILAALYLLWAYQRVFHGEPDEDNAKFPELRVKEGLVLLPFIAAIVFTGVYPKPLLDRIEPSVDALVEHVVENSDFENPEYGTQCGTFEVEHEGEAAESHSDEPAEHDTADTSCDTASNGADHDDADEGDADHGDGSDDDSDGEDGHDEGEETGE